MSIAIHQRLRALARLDFASYIRLSREHGDDSAAQTIDRFVAFARQCERSPVRMPWFDARAPRSVRDLRGRIAAASDQGARRGLFAARLVLWPVVSLMLSLGLAARHRLFLRRESGRTAIGLVVQCLRANLISNIAPSDFFSMRFYRCRSDAEVQAYMVSRDGYAMHAHLQPRHDDIAKIDDKVCFFEHCRALGLPTPPIIAAFNYKGTPFRWLATEALPPSDLFVKPIDRYGGAGAAVWTFDPDSSTWASDGQRCDQQAFLAHHRDLEAIVQPRVRMHRDLQHLSPYGLSCLRAMTLRYRNGEIAFLGALVKIAAGRYAVDNYWTGALIAPIDSDSGRIGPGVARDPLRGTFFVHPDTRGPIDGCVIPSWPEIPRLLARAHRSVPGLTSVGWDVAITDDGPSIVEGNVNWNVELLQVAAARGLGAMAFDAWAMDVLEHASVDL